MPMKWHAKAKEAKSRTCTNPNWHADAGAAG
jgi:hypothetical protein